MKREYGYRPGPIEEKEHIYGGGHNPQKVIINPTGDYRPYAPSFEPQAEKFETWACAVFAILRAIATQYKLLTGKELNSSERFIYILAQIREPGSDPHKVAEIIREHGLIPQEKLPMPDTYKEFLTPDPMEVALLILGQQFLDEWEIKHEWVWKDDEPQHSKKDKLKQIMKYGTVCVSVYGWKKNGLVYFKDESDQDNHFTFLEFIDDKDFNHIFDSYDKDRKVLEPNYNFNRAKVFFLFKRTEPRNPQESQKFVRIGILKRLINFLQQLFNKQVEEEKKETKMKHHRLYELAKSKLGTDFTSDIAVADEFSCAFALSSIWKELDSTLPIITSTREMYEFMKHDKRFEEVPQPIEKIEEGLIVIAPTGMNSKPDVMPNGHCFIAGENEVYMSNDSASGLWKQNYTRESARTRYVKKGGYPLFVFKIK